MTIFVDVTETEARLSERLKKAEAGEEVFIQRDGWSQIVIALSKPYF